MEEYFRDAAGEPFYHLVSLHGRAGVQLQSVCNHTVKTCDEHLNTSGLVYKDRESRSIECCQEYKSVLCTSGCVSLFRVQKL